MDKEIQANQWWLDMWHERTSPLDPSSPNRFWEKEKEREKKIDFKRERVCDAPNPGCPLTTRQPTEYSWMSGNLPDTHENRAEFPLYKELYPDISPVPTSIT